MKFDELNLDGESEKEYLCRRFQGLKHALEKTIRVLYALQDQKVIQVDNHTASSYLDQLKLRKFTFGYDGSKYDLRIHPSSAHMAEVEALLRKLDNYDTTLSEIKKVLSDKYAIGVQ